MPSSSPFLEKNQEKTSLLITKLLACGKFPVYHAHSPSSKAEYALKLFPKDSQALPLFTTELKFLSMLNHPNVIKYISHHSIHQNNVPCNMLVTEYAPHGDFFDLVMSKRLQGDETLVRSFFRQLIEGLEYLHLDHQIAHCDVKLENLLIGKDCLLKIADFDEARTVHDNINNLYGTEGYRAPEVIEGTCQDAFSADIYSAGVALYIMITGEMPFGEINCKGGKKLEGYEEFCEDNERFWEKKTVIYRRRTAALCGEDFRTLINGMLSKNPGERFSLKQIKESKWYEGQIYTQEELEGKVKKIFCKKN